MKTAEEILDKYLANYPWQHWSKENAIKAMEEYRLQSHPSPMSADAKPFTEENVKDMIESDATYEWMANNMNEFIFEWLKSNAPSVKADGWVIPDNVTLKDIKAVRDYFGEHDKSPFEHRAFDVMNKLVDYFTPHQT